eukprot:CAMPEP_0203822454 /NCGR_PEP_ID=MMETSP0115-20131106/46206_1 /ASSEMBLY_ACC=CAM_ASM_000227 /TAXON_ID=33651 /ORGANISM="Bicosoecid sp, Strain ms1" /LENGTH=31 /DNA_ID= /DNA_START= /DNA_END= /DNA_ORIENTATION=
MADGPRSALGAPRRAAMGGGVDAARLLATRG